MTDRYHHGDLPNALRSAAVEVIAENGLGHFSLREVARRAGVSHTAPAHHFGDVRGLLTSLATEGFDTLYSVTSAAVAAETDARRAALGDGRGVRLTRHRVPGALPGHVPPRRHRHRRRVPGRGGNARRTGCCTTSSRELVEAEGLHTDVDAAAELCWATMQGLVVLEPKLVLIDAREGRAALTTRDRVRRLTALMLDGIRHSAP